MTQSSFDPPMESLWHRMISEAAYFLAEERGFEPGHAVDDWLRAELKVKEALVGCRNEVTR
jgi:hypothetical protein